MQFMKRKSITFVLLVIMLMSWTGIAFAFVPATPIQESSEHAESTSHHVAVQSHCQDMAVHTEQMPVNDHCQQDVSVHQHNMSHEHCQECVTPQCQTSVFNIYVVDEQQFALDKLVLQADRNFNYIASNSSDFRQDILRPPQA